MKEEEIINNIKTMLENNENIFEETGTYTYFSKPVEEDVKGLLDLYEKEKEKNKRLCYKVITLKNKLSYDIEHINNKLSSNEYINDIRVARLKGIRMKCKEILKYL